MLNKVILMGRLTRDPELKNTQSGIPICRFSVAVERRFADKTTGQRETDFLDCTAFRGTAEFLARYFSKGSMILVEGAIQNNNYTDNNGVKHYSHNIMVDNVSFCGGKNEGNPSQAEQTQTEPASTDIEQFAADVNAETVTGQEVPF